MARAKAAFDGWRAVTPVIVPASCERSPTRSPRAPRIWPGSKLATSASRSVMRGARSGWSPRPSPTWRARPSGCSATRSRSPAGVDMTFREPLGVVGLIIAVELPAADRVLEGGPGAGGRQHDRAEARRADPADRDRAREDRARGRPSRGRAERRRRARTGRRRASRAAPRRRQGRLHRLDCRRPAGRARSPRSRSSA